MPTRKPEIVRWITKVAIPDNPASGCWLWQGYCDPLGYGRFTYADDHQGRQRAGYAHVWSYTHFIGPVPAGCEVSHICNVNNCVSPFCLVGETHAENLARSENQISTRNANKTHCERAGHPLTGDNVGRDRRGNRHCLTCAGAYQRTYKRSLRHAERQREYEARRRAKLTPEQREQKRAANRERQRRHYGSMTAAAREQYNAAKRRQYHQRQTQQRVDANADPLA